MPLKFIEGKWKVTRNGYPIQQHKLIDKHGEIIYKLCTKNEAADYALRHQLLIVRERKKKK